MFLPPQGPHGVGYYRDNNAPDQQANAKARSAARHTYDVGYKKWDRLDVGDDSDDESKV